MPGGKKNTVYRRKRKGKPLTGVQRSQRKQRKHCVRIEKLQTQHQVRVMRLCQIPKVLPSSASRLKMRPEDSPESSSRISEVNDFQAEGYRLVDLKKLSAMLSEAHVCEEGEKTYK